ncbi:MAG: primosomal protein N' [Oscillospiraceae bacterium]|nr:primosomal protein N' [Oscillospiraceae bacterium]
MGNGKYIAGIAVHAANYPMDRAYSYLIPEALYRPHLEGCRAVVPFGRGNRKQVGMILSISLADDRDAQGLKSVLSIADPAPVLGEEQLLLVHWLRENAFSSYYDAIHALLPAAMQLRLEEHYVLRDGDTAALSEEAGTLLSFLRRARSRREMDALLDIREAPEKQTLISELMAHGLLDVDTKTQMRTKGRKLRMVTLRQDASELRLPPKQQQVADALRKMGTLSEKELCYICGVTTAVIKPLVTKGICTITEVDPPDETPAPLETPPPLTLSDEQQAVFDTVAPFLETKEAKCFLLRGVTGSGKTLVFEALIERTLELGKSVLLLLPEIGLTPQTVRRLAARFGEHIAVVHSGLSLTERRRSYERAKHGEARLVIGTRSAVFSPLPDLGLIVMDEEGERSYKSDSAPRYDTIQVARQRVQYHGAVLLAASATPTLESYYYAKKGIYDLLEMKHRYGDVPLPKVEMIDMNLERMAGNESEFSTALHDAVTQNLARGEQSILLLNRRGYHTIISCCTCNQPVYCENCSVPMTYHKPDGNLHCHYCGSIRRMPETCPTCGGPHLRRMGFGTQRLEEELAVRFPKARILRMDADTTGSRYAYEQGFEAFRRGEYDIMLGTQMIGKGLDFPNVTLVGVMSVDKALFSGDIRSYERTFSLITQVVGRGGRGGKPGRAILQTFMPDHYVLRLAAAQDYEAFAREELSVRKQLLYPPFCDICVIGVTGETEDAVRIGAETFLECMKKELAVCRERMPLRVLGPVPFNYHKLGGKFRWRIIIKCKNNKAFRHFLETAMKSACSMREMSRVHIYADMNGSAEF